MAGPAVPPEVQAGAQFLDEAVGEQWFEKVNLDTLDLESGCKCVAAQIVGGFEGGYDNAWEYAMFEWGIVSGATAGPDLATVDMEKARRLGFLGPAHSGNPPTWLALENGWRELIAARVSERAEA